MMSKKVRMHRKDEMNSEQLLTKNQMEAFDDVETESYWNDAEQYELDQLTGDMNDVYFD
jgi:hypothetical protein